MTNNDLDLPFDWHFCPNEGQERGTAIVFTTEPEGEEDRIQCDELLAIDADNQDKHGDRCTQLAEFVSDALNAYVNTPQGLEHWKRCHPLIGQMREAGRQ